MLRQGSTWQPAKMLSTLTKFLKLRKCLNIDESTPCTFSREGIAPPHLFYCFQILLVLKPITIPKSPSSLIQ